MLHQRQRAGRDRRDPGGKGILFLPDFFLGAHVRRMPRTATSRCGWANATSMRASVPSGWKR